MIDVCRPEHYLRRSHFQVTAVTIQFANISNLTLVNCALYVVFCSNHLYYILSSEPHHHHTTKLCLLFDLNFILASSDNRTKLHSRRVSIWGEYYSVHCFYCQRQLAYLDCANLPSFFFCWTDVFACLHSDAFCWFFCKTDNVCIVSSIINNVIIIRCVLFALVAIRNHNQLWKLAPCFVLNQSRQRKYIVLLLQSYLYL